MTLKPTQVGTPLALMSLYLLLTTSIAECSQSLKSLAEADVVSVPTEVSPEIFDDHKFATLNSILNSSDEITGLSVRIVGPNNHTRECVLPIVAVPLDIRRLSDKTVLLAVLAVQDRDHEGSPTLALVDTHTCNHTYNIYDGELPLNLRLDMIFTNSENPSDESFSLIANGEKYCRGHKWCRLSFDPQFRKFEPLDFDVDLTWNPFDQTVKPATKSDKDRFVVRFNDPEANVHHMRLYDLSDNRVRSSYKDLLTLTDYESDGMIFGKLSSHFVGEVLHDVAYSDWSAHCWRKHFEIYGHFDLVHCTRFRDDGSVLFNQTIRSLEPVNGMRVVPIPNGLVLFSGSAQGCTPCNPCDTVQVDVLTSVEESTCARVCGGDDGAVEVKSGKFDFGCKIVGIKSEMKVRVIDDDSIEVEYVCKSEERVSLNRIVMRWDGLRQAISVKKLHKSTLML